MTLEDWFVENEHVDNAALRWKVEAQAEPYSYEVLKGGDCVITKRIKNSLETEYNSLNCFSDKTATIVPGMLVVCDEKLADNKPTIPPFKTKEIKLQTDLKDSQPFMVVDVKNSDYKTALDKEISTWLEKHQDGNITANLKQQVFQIKDKHQISAHLKAGYKNDDLDLKVDMKAVHNGEKNAFVFEYTQAYFTVTADDVLAHEYLDCTVNDLKKRKISKDKPLGYVKSATYGRTIYAIVETEDTTIKVDEDGNFYKGKDEIKVDEDVHTNFQNKNYKASIKIIGGGTALLKKYDFTKLENLKSIIQDGINFDKDAGWSLISYTVNYLDNNEEAIYNSSVEWVDTEVTTKKGTKVTVYQEAWYQPHTVIGYEKIVGEKDGAEITEYVKVHEENHWTKGNDFSFDAPGNAKTLIVRISGKDFTRPITGGTLEVDVRGVECLWHHKRWLTYHS
ncbi:MAG: thiol-activated cytolysin family protein [Clostridia bacterium]|nr:thiol-activated cytolysin family protein [Clostridia bacterium]